MTNPINYQNQTIPPYSGITINITNPTINPPGANHICSPSCPIHTQQAQNPNIEAVPQALGGVVTNPIQNTNSISSNEAQATNSTEKISETSSNIIKDSSTEAEVKNPQDGLPQAYPPQYYLNNYNYIQNGEKGQAQENALPKANEQVSAQNNQMIPVSSVNDANQAREEDLTSSKEIIDGLDARVAEQKELEKNGKQTRVIALTNEYIMSLENYLNNPNTEIRLMAAKEILTRLDEDKNRFDDAALNALLNKMLQDPEKLVRIAALSAFSSQLASGNDYTVQLLTKIQNNPNADKEDVLQAADSLLKMSSRTEIRYTPQNNYVVQSQAEQ